MGRKPRGEEVESWCGVLDYYAFQSTQKSLRTRDMFGVIILVIGHVERVLIGLKTCHLRGVCHSLATPTSMPSQLLRVLKKVVIGCLLHSVLGTYLTSILVPWQSLRGFFRNAYDKLWVIGINLCYSRTWDFLCSITVKYYVIFPTRVYQVIVVY